MEDLRQLYTTAKKISCCAAYQQALCAEDEEEKRFYAYIGWMNLQEKMANDANKNQLFKEMGFTMRDITRIDPLLAKLGEAWKKHPDLRFGQFMVNFFGECQCDPFYHEEEVWMDALQAYIDGNSPKEAIEKHYGR